jgi:hypothetical protein
LFAPSRDLKRAIISGGETFAELALRFIPIFSLG